MNQWMVISRTLILTALATSLSSCTSDSETVTASIGENVANDKNLGEPTKPSYESNQHPEVRIHTSEGPITVRLNGEKSPHTVRNFLEYTTRKHYDGTIFHYVAAGEMVLGGGYDVDGKRKISRAAVMNEGHNGLSNSRGTIAMAREAGYAHSATCEFFFNLTDNETLNHRGRDTADDYGYCVFGEVIQGLDILDRIGSEPVRATDQFSQLPINTVVIDHIELLQE